MKLAQALADAFLGEGVQRVFNVMGDGNLEWLAGMARRPACLVHVRHELAAVAMADGYARLSGRIGVASVTCGPGLTHSATSIRAAARHRTPLIVFAGEYLDPDARQHLDQSRFVESLGGVAHRIRSVATFAVDVRRAFHVALTDRMPVVLSVPPELSAAEIGEEGGYCPVTATSPEILPLPPAEAAVGSVSDALQAAQRPLVLVGGGAADAAPEIEEIARTTGALTCSTLLAQGWTAASTDLGVAGRLASPRARALAQSSDFVLAIGSSLDPYTLVDFIAPETPIALVDVKARPDHLVVSRVVCHVRADAKLFARALLPAIADRAGSAEASWAKGAVPTAEPEAPRQTSFDDGRLDPRPVLTRIDELFPADRTMVTGASHLKFCVSAMRPPRYPRLFSYGFGSIGQVLPTAIGAAFAQDGQPVLAVDGDSSFLMNVQELDTAVRYGLPVCTVILNNSALGSDYYKLEDLGYDPSEAVLRDVDFAGIARGFGARGRTVRDLADVGAALAEFAREPGPMVLDVKTSLQVPN